MRIETIIFPEMRNRGQGLFAGPENYLGNDAHATEGARMRFRDLQDKREPRMCFTCMRECVLPDIRLTKRLYRDGLTGGPVLQQAGPG